jgi:hypothetical protein
VVLQFVTVLQDCIVIQQIMHANSFQIAQSQMEILIILLIATVAQQLALLLLEGSALQVLIRVSPKLPAQTLI